ncbi:hypothetical protein NIES4101_29790 [Calothrix sp. NIES-4101]|nr:hypothetical protein NIES4101_29790 [Calothrix sp. NIES-4101]
MKLPEPDVMLNGWVNPNAKGKPNFISAIRELIRGLHRIIDPLIRDDRKRVIKRVQSA